MNDACKLGVGVEAFCGEVVDAGIRRHDVLRGLGRSFGRCLWWEIEISKKAASCLISQNRIAAVDREHGAGEAAGGFAGEEEDG